MRKTGLYTVALAILLAACKSEDYQPLTRLNVPGTYQKEVVIEKSDVTVRFDVVADRRVDEDMDVLLALNSESTAKLNKHFVLDKSTLRIYKGESKTSGKVKILQENFDDGELYSIVIDMKSANAVFDTNRVFVTISMGEIRQPRPVYPKVVSLYGTYAGISGFTFAGIDNNAPVVENRGGSADAALDFTKQYASVVKGQEYEYKITPDWCTTGPGDIYRAIFFIDWNKDGDYADEGEMIVNKLDIDKATAETPIIGKIVVPENAVPGVTGIRIGFFLQDGETVFGDEGYGVMDSGEIEDYSLIIE